MTLITASQAFGETLEQLEELITKTKEELNVGSNDPEAIPRETE